LAGWLIGWLVSYPVGWPTYSFTSLSTSNSRQHFRYITSFPLPTSYKSNKSHASTQLSHQIRQCCQTVTALSVAAFCFPFKPLLFPCRGLILNFKWPQGAEHCLHSAARHVSAINRHRAVFLKTSAGKEERLNEGKKETNTHRTRNNI
jgi:hypothetical protein